MPKKAIRVPAARTGRGVRWTLEVTANVDGAAQAAKTSSARGPAKSEKKPARVERSNSGEKTGARNTASKQAAAKSKTRRKAPRLSDAATTHVVIAPAPAIVAPAVTLPQSSMPMAPEFDSPPVWSAPSAWDHSSAASSEGTPATPTPRLPESADASRQPHDVPAAIVGTVQADPVVSSQLVSRKGLPVGSRTGHQNAVKMVAAAVIAVAIVTALALTRDPSARSSVALSAAPATSSSSPVAADAPIDGVSRRTDQESRKSELTSSPAAIPATLNPQTKLVPEKTKPARDARLTTTATSPSMSVATIPVAPPVAAPVPDTPIVKPVTAEANVAPAVLETSRSASAQPSVSITGCLETDGERFRLTETDGADAPKSRGWRSGFLKKKSAPVELVALSDPAALRKYVGHRVVATGPLESRSLQVRSFQPSGAMCD